MQPTLYKKQPKIGRTQPVEIVRLLVKGEKSMNNNFSNNIKKIRKEHNLSQEQLAEELGVSRQAISKWESGAAYPEMDKIISICEKYNCNIDDLLHRDIKEAKGEEEAKKNANRYIEEFFKFITDSINLFTRMKFGSKCKCLFEQGLIAIALWIAGSIIYGLLSTIMHRSVLSFMPNVLYNRIEGFFQSIYVLVAFVIGVIIMVRIFKARYLNYYVEAVEEQKDDKPIKTNGNSKIELEKESKIIVRNPEHSDYHFLRALLKVFLLGVKFFALWFAAWLCMGLVMVGIGFVLSFLVNKTGLFFLGCILGCASAGVILGVIIILLFNFIFNRKSNMKAMIYSFVIAVVLVGFSVGMVLIGSLQFDLVDTPKNVRTDNIEIEMQENLFMGNRHEVEYIVEERDNVRIECVLDDQLTSKYNVNDNGSIQLYSYAENQMKVFRNELKELNNKKIYPLNGDFVSIKVYASAENIEKLQNNFTTYHDTINSYQTEIDELHTELDEKNREIDELNEKLLGCNMEEPQEETQELE